jgi:hypothetical protein
VRVLALFALVLAIALPATAAAFPVGLQATPHTLAAGSVLHVHGNVGNGCSHHGSVTVISNAFHSGHDFAGVNAIFIKIRPSGNFAATTRIPSSRAPGAYHVGARCGGGSFGNITLQVT